MVLPGSSDHLVHGSGRLAGLSERRCIIRQDVGHQRTLVVGAVYTSEISNEVLDLSHGEAPFVEALGYCIKLHPVLSQAIVGGGLELPEFAAPKELDLSKHIQIRKYDGSSTEDSAIRHLLVELSDEQFSAVDATPPWKTVIMPLPSGESSSPSLVVLFAYYHSHGDGKSGLAFQRTFLEGLNQSKALDQASKDQVNYFMLCEPCLTSLPLPIEKAGKLSLSWAYLLSPLLGAYMPSFLATALGFRASWIAQDNNIWRGKDLTFDTNNFRTGLEMVTIEYDTMRSALQRCKTRQTTFTGLLNHLIARALSDNVPAEAFASQVVLDLRHLFQGAYTDESMMNCVSAYNETIIRSAPEATQDWTNPASGLWTAARSTSAGLVESSNTLHNQPIGLLQYLNEFRPWTLGQIGKKREGSYEISNLVVFNPAPKTELPHPAKSAITIEKTVFSQPANAAGALLNFNLVSTQGGPLVMTVTWQMGMLDLGEDKQESAFVQTICSSVQKYIAELAVAPLYQENQHLGGCAEA